MSGLTPPPGCPMEDSGSSSKSPKSLVVGKPRKMMPHFRSSGFAKEEDEELVMFTHEKFKVRNGTRGVSHSSHYMGKVAHVHLGARNTDQPPSEGCVSRLRRAVKSGLLPQFPFPPCACGTPAPIGSLYTSNSGYPPAPWLLGPAVLIPFFFAGIDLVVFH